MVSKNKIERYYNCIYFILLRKKHNEDTNREHKEKVLQLVLLAKHWPTLIKYDLVNQLMKDTINMNIDSGVVK